MNGFNKDLFREQIEHFLKDSDFKKFALENLSDHSEKFDNFWQYLSACSQVYDDILMGIEE